MAVQPSLYHDNDRKSTMHHRFNWHKNGAHLLAVLVPLVVVYKVLICERGKFLGMFSFSSKEV